MDNHAYKYGSVLCLDYEMYRVGFSQGWMGHPWVLGVDSNLSSSCDSTFRKSFAVNIYKGYGQGSFASAYISKIWVLGSFHLELHGTLRNLAVLNACGATSPEVFPSRYIATACC